MKLYVLFQGNRSYYDKAFTNKENALNAISILNNYYNTKYELKEYDLPFIGKYVCYVYGYYGFDYDYTNCEIRSLVSRSEIFACLLHAKESFQWKEAVNMSDGKTDLFTITNTKIASKEADGSDFIYGDCARGMFNVSIKRIRVIKV